MTILEDLPTQKLNTSGQQEFLSIRLFCGSQNEQESSSKLQTDTFLIIWTFQMDTTSQEKKATFTCNHLRVLQIQSTKFFS